MKPRLLRGFFFLVVVFVVGLLRADGFALGTVVHTTQGIIPIEDCIIGNCVYTNQKLVTSSIYHTTSYCADRYIKITIDDECIDASSS